MEIVGTIEMREERVVHREDIAMKVREIEIILLQVKISDEEMINQEQVEMVPLQVDQHEILVLLQADQHEILVLLQADQHEILVPREKKGTRSEETIEVEMQWAKKISGEKIEPDVVKERRRRPNTKNKISGMIGMMDKSRSLNVH
jgi:hypothetical protein